MKRCGVRYHNIISHWSPVVYPIANTMTIADDVKQKVKSFVYLALSPLVMYIRSSVEGPVSTSHPSWSSLFISFSCWMLLRQSTLELLITLTETAVELNSNLLSSVNNLRDWVCWSDIKWWMEFFPPNWKMSKSMRLQWKRGHPSNMPPKSSHPELFPMRVFFIWRRTNVADGKFALLEIINTCKLHVRWMYFLLK